MKREPLEQCLFTERSTEIVDEKRQCYAPRQRATNDRSQSVEAAGQRRMPHHRSRRSGPPAGPGIGVSHAAVAFPHSGPSAPANWLRADIQRRCSRGDEAALTRLSVGNIQVVDQFGNLADWTVSEQAGVLWIRKDRGPALIPHDSLVQTIRSFDGRISVRLSDLGPGAAAGQQQRRPERTSRAAPHARVGRARPFYPPRPVARRIRRISANMRWNR